MLYLENKLGLLFLEEIIEEIQQERLVMIRIQHHVSFWQNACQMNVEWYLYACPNGRGQQIRTEVIFFGMIQSSNLV